MRDHRSSITANALALASILLAAAVPLPAQQGLPVSADRLLHSSVTYARETANVTIRMRLTMRGDVTPQEEMIAVPGAPASVAQPPLPEPPAGPPPAP